MHRAAPVKLMEVHLRLKSTISPESRPDGRTGGGAGEELVGCSSTEGGGCGGECGVDIAGKSEGHRQNCGNSWTIAVERTAFGLLR